MDIPFLLAYRVWGSNELGNYIVEVTAPENLSFKTPLSITPQMIRQWKYIIADQVETVIQRGSDIEKAITILSIQPLIFTL